jgi:hypothetical protein
MCLPRRPPPSLPLPLPRRGIFVSGRGCYAVGMNTSLDFLPGRWALLVLPHDGHSDLLVAAARLAFRGPVVILDGGNRCNAYTLARAAGGRPEVLGRIFLSRAFTCYQMAALLEDTPAGAAPVLLLDFLSTFYDEAVSAFERRRLLEGCLVELRRLSRGAGVAVSICLPKVASPENGALLASLHAAADGVWLPAPALPAAEPPRLF